MEKDCRYTMVDETKQPPAYCSLLRERLEIVNGRPVTSKNCPFLQEGIANSYCVLNRELPENVYVKLDEAAERRMQRQFPMDDAPHERYIERVKPKIVPRRRNL